MGSRITGSAITPTRPLVVHWTFITTSVIVPVKTRVTALTLTIATVVSGVFSALIPRFMVRYCCQNNAEAAMATRPSDGHSVVSAMKESYDALRQQNLLIPPMAVKP
ncbi:MAG: hypothetical protein MK103_02920 [Planctomycetes bacterium]|nr:hypothetical protein [Planctomycetota bacterium]